MSKKQKHNSYKIILIGDSRVGKTSLLNSINCSKSKSLNQNYPPTIGVQYVTKYIQSKNNKKQFKSQIWDTCIPLIKTAGAQKYQSITSSYYRKSQGAILVFDVTQKQTFQNLDKWIANIKKYSDKNISIVLVANKMDLVAQNLKQRKVSESEITSFCVDHHITFKQTSATTGYNVSEVFEEIFQKIDGAGQKGGQQWQSYSQAIKISFMSDNTILNKKQSSGISLQKLQQKYNEKCPKCC